MLGSSGSTHSYIGSLMIDPHTSDQPKVDLGHLYCRQQHAVEIIQLIEVPAPSRRFTSSPIDSRSSSSCYSSEPESEYTSDDEAEPVGPSYCSSDTPEQMDSEEEEISNSDKTYDIRVTRVHAWRANFAKDMGLAPDILPMSSTKRKAPDEYEIDEQTGSYSSKRLSWSHSAHNASSLTTHICAACDESFPTRQNLQQHGQATQANDACRIAVEYNFE